jgi:hypothetical protein
MRAHYNTFLRTLGKSVSWQLKTKGTTTTSKTIRPAIGEITITNKTRLTTDSSTKIRARRKTNPWEQMKLSHVGSATKRSSTN